VIFRKFLQDFIRYCHVSYSGFEGYRESVVRLRQGATFGLKAAMSYPGRRSIKDISAHLGFKLGDETGSHRVLSISDEELVVLSYSQDFLGLLATRLLTIEGAISRRVRAAPGLSLGKLRTKLPLRPEELNMVDERVDNPLNGPEYFDLLTRLLIQLRTRGVERNRKGVLTLDYSRCVELEKQLAQEEDAEDLAADLEGI